MNECINALYNRKSVRVYEEKPIEPEKKQAILKAALQAPTAGNMMLYSILDITDQALKDRLALTCDNQPFIAKAPLVLIFVADYQRWYDSFSIVAPAVGEKTLRKPGEGDLLLAACDALIAAQNTVVAAEALGLGSCYIGDILEEYETHRALLQLPKYVLPICMLCYGYPTQQQKDRKKPTRFESDGIVSENVYHHLTEPELRTLFAKQAGTPDFDFEKSVGAMLQRKWNCRFSEEMTRSVAKMFESWK